MFTPPPKQLSIPPQFQTPGNRGKTGIPPQALTIEVFQLVHLYQKNLNPAYSINFKTFKKLPTNNLVSSPVLVAHMQYMP